MTGQGFDLVQSVNMEVMEIGEKVSNQQIFYQPINVEEYMQQ